jgi:hypothetical protein
VIVNDVEELREELYAHIRANDRILANFGELDANEINAKLMGIDLYLQEVRKTMGSLERGLNYSWFVQAALLVAVAILALKAWGHI